MTLNQTKWNLGELFPGYDSPELEAAFDQVEEQVTSFEGVRGKLKPEMEAGQFLEIVNASEATSRIISKLYAFASLSFAADTQDQAAQTLVARLDQFAAEMQNRTLFFSLWWKELDEQNARRLMEAAGDYRYYLEQLRLFKPHTLSEAEEKISQSQKRDRRQRPDHTLQLDHESLHLQARSGRRSQRTDAERTAGLSLQPRPGPAGAKLPGTIARLQPGRRRSSDRCTRPWCATGIMRTYPCASSPARSRRATWATTFRMKRWTPCWKSPGRMQGSSSAISN